MTIENEIQVIIETLEAVDDITTMRAENKDDKAVYDEEDATWETRDYKAELYALLGKKLYEYSKTGTIQFGTGAPAAAATTTE